MLHTKKFSALFSLFVFVNALTAQQPQNNLNAGMTAISPVNQSYKQKLIPNCIHCFNGEFDVKDSYTFNNFFIELGVGQQIRSSKFFIEGSLGLQNFVNKTNKIGSYKGYSDFEGKISIQRIEMSALTGIKLNYHILDNKNILICTGMDIKIEYMFINQYSIKMANSTTETKYNVTGDNLCLTNNLYGDINYKLTTKLLASLSLRLIVLNYKTAFEDHTSERIAYLNNDPFSVRDIRSAIYTTGYLLTSFSIKYILNDSKK